MKRQWTCTSDPTRRDAVSNDEMLRVRGLPGYFRGRQLQVDLDKLLIPRSAKRLIQDELCAAERKVMHDSLLCAVCVYIILRAIVNI